MKTSFATLAAVFVTLCTTSTALAETPPPSGDAPAVTPATVPQFYYSETENLRVPIAPQILTSPDEVTINSGEELRLEIKYTGSPTPTVLVLYNRKFVNFSDTNKYFIHCEVGTCIFKIYCADPSDSGLYTFRAVNTAGEAEVSFDVIVL